MTLMERRRALMGAGTSDILWQIANKTVQDKEHIDTGIALLDTDRDYSIAVDMTADRELNGRRLFYHGTTFTYGPYNASVLIFSYNGKTVGTFGSATAGRHRFVIVRNAENDLIRTKYRKNNGTPVTKSATIALSGGYTFTLKLGGYSSDELGLPNGTIHKMVIYNRMLSDAEIDSWLDV